MSFTPGLSEAALSPAMPQMSQWTPQPALHHDLDFRQLRHHTKNSLQRILIELERSAALQDSDAGRRLIDDLQRRILLAASVSDALFGLTVHPGALADRLRLLGQSLIQLMGDEDQQLRLDVVVDETCPPDCHETVLRVAHEMLGNAIKHGMRARLVGAITVLVIVRSAHLRLVVVDDGWGPDGMPQSPHGEGLLLMRDLAALQRGWVSLRRLGDHTVAEMVLPRPAEALA